ncbi:hypothetical protein TRIUR3_07706 [Triticum urartu]|uniref:Uncharacterized protein n=1 Tax=Triticum urartu TaxID=4572 RepID=M7Z4L2_TRIUA|nr:hypothetical protein TRIUR3_07706 [Triticum urartu]
MAAAVAALVICSVLLPLAFLLGLHRNGGRSQEAHAYGWSDSHASHLLICSMNKPST